ncbi:MmgE/PrpD family protein [Rhodococcoides fascians]|uniref:MmgE/PrpD family protein n=1 Tax=Rhodococcoides fascians TaxID=1828 RepID=UPI00050C03C3|nr:MmgE/PrpD family protein [Rhodococcus fascians]
MTSVQPNAVTAELSSFISETTYSDIPDVVLDKLALHTVDGMSAMLAGQDMAWTVAVRDYALEEGAPGLASVVGDGRRVRPAMATLVNATAMHGLELDDYHVPAAVHAGCVTVPTALAISEQLDCTSRQLLTAMAVGYETTIRLGLAMSPEMTLDRSFHVTSAFGPFGSTAAAANLHKLSAQQTASALGLAAAQAGGTTEYTRSGGEVKRLHAGFAAFNGIRAVELARRGVTGPAHAIEGPRGFAAAFGGSRVDLGMLTQGLGTDWNTDGLGIKAWSTCTGNHAPIAAMTALREQGLDSCNIESITVYTDRTTAEHCGHVGPRVSDLTGAQFSLHVSLAMCLVLGGNDPSHYSTFELADFDLPDVANLAERVTIVVGAEQESASATAPSARVVVRRYDGSTVDATRSAPGGPTMPYLWDDVADKLRRGAAGSIDTATIDSILHTVARWRSSDVAVRQGKSIWKRPTGLED